MKIPWPILTILALAVVVLVLIFFPRSCGEAPKIDGNLTPDQENILNARITVLEHYSDSLLQELDKSKASGKKAESAFKIEIKAKAKTIAELKSRPVVVQLVQETPALDSLHQAYDGAMVAYEGRNMALTLEMQTRDRLANELIANFEKRLADTQQLLQEKELENQQLTKENKKLKAGRVLRNIAIPVLTVGAFILGVVAVD